MEIETDPVAVFLAIMGFMFLVGLVVIALGGM
jgi:hypothetical protein